MSAAAALAFDLPAALEATEPPEARGLARDDVRLMVATRRDGRIEHAHFRDLPGFLAPGDLLVVNTSATLPAAVPATREDGTAVELRFATAAPHPPAHGDWWVVELRCAGGARPLRGTRAGERVTLAGGAHVEIAAPYGGLRLWLARVHDTGGPLYDYLASHGHPIRYGYVPREWPLADYQTAFARDPGSAEMPSAGRPFTPNLLFRLARAGVGVAPLTLHTGVSSPERREAPHPERYRVAAATARAVNATRDASGRAIAVGTTVVRALESAAAPDGTVSAAGGWTNLVISAERPLRAVDGLITGWHEPEASHLLMLEAAAGERLLADSYRSALEHGYLWHEFGDSHLILP